MYPQAIFTMNTNRVKNHTPVRGILKTYSESLVLICIYIYIYDPNKSANWFDIARTVYHLAIYM